MKYSTPDEETLMRDLWDPSLTSDPYAFVMYVYPWGQEGTPLQKHKGPRKWQTEELIKLGNHIKENQNLIQQGLNPEMYNLAIASGRGPGKSAFLAWIGHFVMTVATGSTVIYTANTEAQLKSRTWAEYGKWLTMAINSHWFDKTATTVKPQQWFDELLKDQLKIDTGYYYAQAQLWSEENPDAFAGAHNPHGICVIYDEGSGIPVPIWTVTEGFFTEPELHRYWFVMSNPRRSKGGFFECFHKHRNFWNTRHIDSRDVEGNDPKVFEKILAKHGVDSDEARIEVYGQFPSQGDKQFIARHLVEEAQTREVDPDPWAPLMMGVDVARFGGDNSVIRWRRGRDARSIPARKFKRIDNMQLAYRVAEAIDDTNPDAVCIDAGNGSGVIDRLRELGYSVHEIWFGGKADSPEWFDRRTEMYARIRDWLGGGMIDGDDALHTDLTAPEYGFHGAGGDRIKLQSKDEMRAEGFASTDDGDALGLTFAVKVPRKDTNINKRKANQQVADDVDYDIFG